MPVVAIFLGAILVDLGFRGTQHEFAKQLEQDLSVGHFWAWVASITILGAIGYYSPAKKISDVLLLLVILGLTLSQKGIYAQFASIFDNPPKPAPGVSLASYETSASSSGSSSGGLGGLISGAADIGQLAGVLTL